MFWLWDKNDIDNTPVFVVSAKQCCTEPIPFSVKESSPRRGGNWIKTADLHCLQGYSIPCDIMQKEFWRRWGDTLLSSTAWELAGHQVGGGKLLLVRHLLYTFIYTCIYIITIILFSVLVLSQHSLVYFFFWFSPSSQWEEREWVKDCVALL